MESSALSFELIQNQAKPKRNEKYSQNHAFGQQNHGFGQFICMMCQVSYQKSCSLSGGLNGSL